MDVDENLRPFFEVDMDDSNWAGIDEYSWKAFEADLNDSMKVLKYGPERWYFYKAIVKLRLT